MVLGVLRVLWSARLDSKVGSVSGFPIQASLIRICESCRVGGSGFRLILELTLGLDFRALANLAPAQV